MRNSFSGSLRDKAMSMKPRLSPLSALMLINASSVQNKILLLHELGEGMTSLLCMTET